MDILELSSVVIEYIIVVDLYILYNAKVKIANVYTYCTHVYEELSFSV